MSCQFIVTGNYSDSPFALDVSELLGSSLDIADMISLKSYANSEFCPRFIPEDTPDRKIGHSLKGKIVIICSVSYTAMSRNELAMRNLIIARGAKDNKAEKVILVEPDLFYSAQDRGPHRYGAMESDRSEKDLQKFDGQPFTSMLYAQLLKNAGVDMVVTVHNHSRKVQALFTDIFDGNFHNLIPSDLYADYIRKSNFVNAGTEGENLVICAPDRGAKPMCDLVWESLGMPRCGRIVMDKVRTGERSVSMDLAISSDHGLSDVRGKDVIILDDMVRTGSTITMCSKFLRQGAPRRICFAVTHFQPSQEARENLNCKDLDEILTTSTIPSILDRDCQGRLRRKLAVLKIGKWVSRHILTMLGMDRSRFDNDFYTVDMSSKNPRSKNNFQPIHQGQLNLQTTYEPVKNC